MLIALFLGGVVATLALGSVSVGSARTNGPPSGAVAAGAPSPNPTSNGDLTANGTGPGSAQDSAFKISVAYRIELVNVSNPAGPYSVQIPGLVALLPTATSELHLYLGPTNFTAATRTAVSPYYSTGLRVPPGTSFSTVIPAELSSQGVALTASWAYGQGTIAVQWQWIATFGDGSQQSGPVSPWQYVVPTELVTIASSPPTTLPPGASYPICLTGPVAGRTFAVHFSSLSPVVTYDGPQVTVPASYGAEYCWNSSLPAPTAPETLAVHLWEYGQLTFLIYESSVAVENGSPPASHSTAPPTAVAPWFAPTLVVGIAICIGLAVWIVGSRRPPANGAPPPVRPPP
jgi:hypothetical protein